MVFRICKDGNQIALVELGLREGFLIENILNSIPAEIEAHYFRTSASAEIDLLLTPPGRSPIAIENQRSLSASASKGFHIAADDVKAGPRFLPP